MTVKIGDFVDSVVKKNKNEKINDNLNVKFTLCGGPLIYSPEMIEKVEYFQKSDVYSMGVTFYELCPFKKKKKRGKRK